MATDQPLKLPRNLPPPPELPTDDELRRIADSACQRGAAVYLQTESLERLTPEDLRIRLR